MKTKFFRGVLLLLVCLTALPAGAATFTVTTGADSGQGSLRQAVLNANATPGADEIRISSSIREITLSSEVNISTPLTVKGGGATLKGSTTRLFSVTNGTAKFDRLTFTKGKAFSGNGGAVNVEGAAKADFVNCTFFGNDAGARGGAVCVSSSGLDATTFLNCTIAGNSATNGGGVAVVQGAVSFAGSIVTGNTERGGLPQGTDVYADVGGSVFNSGRYNVIGSTNASGSFGVAQGNRLSVSSADVFQAANPLALTTVDGVQVLKLSSLSGNAALDLIPTGSVGFPSEDQRGVSRPQLLGLDAGAFELSPVPVASIDLTGSPYIQLGHREPYSVAVHPADAARDVRTYKDGIEWSVSDPSVLSVDRSGVVSALKAGDATLYARVHGWDAAGNTATSSTVSRTIRVGTTPLPAPGVEIQSLGDRTVQVGSTQSFKPTVIISLAGSATDLDYTLNVFSSNTGAASADVSSDGRSILLAGLSQGTSQITVTAAASNSAGTGRDTKTFTLTVSNKSSGGGGGCSAGLGGLALALVGAFLLRRKV